MVPICIIGATFSVIVTVVTAKYRSNFKGSKSILGVVAIVYVLMVVSLVY